MKILFTISLLFLFSATNSQDSSKFKMIDSLVSIINTSGLQVQRDTLVQDYPEVGLKMTTYLSMIATNTELLKYVNYVKSDKVEDAVAIEMTASNTFYYLHNQLIKVEEFVIQPYNDFKADWYFWDGKSLNDPLPDDKEAPRSKFLLELSRAMLNQIVK
ncbi:MAG: hypothetical protein WAT19_02415 [Ferruginibacter sp.]